MTEPTAVWQTEPLELDPAQFRVEGAWRRWRRRLVSLSAIGLGLLVAVALTPVVLPLALLFDLLVRRRLATLRFLVFTGWVLVLHILATALGLWLWLAAGGRGSRRDRAWLDRHFRAQAWWSGQLFWSFVRLFNIRVIVEGEAEAQLHRGPILLFARHASVADTLLPASFVANRHGLHLRYVLKRELLWNPCLDIFGHRLPNYFVDRRSTDSRAEAEAVGRLGARLGPRDGVLIFPEGTRFTPSKREQILASLSRRGDPAAHARAAALHHTLPPRLGGCLQLLTQGAGADVVFLAHVGFEAVQHLPNLVNGRLIGRTIRLRFWRAPHDTVPPGDAARTRWLHERWGELDRWIGAHR